MKKFLFSLVTAVLCAAPAFAQDAAPEATPAPEAAPAEAPADAAAPAADTRNTKAEDPVDRVVAHLMNLNDIILKNMGDSEALLTEFKSYLDKNDKAMRMASKAFREKVDSLKASEAEAYREVAQRKLTPVLDNLVTLFLQFYDRDPAASAKLDSLLKVDARYTYDP